MNFQKKYIPDVDSFIFGFDCHTDNAILRTKIDSLIDVIQKMRIVYEIQPKGALLRFNSLLFEMLYLLYHSFFEGSGILPVQKKMSKIFVRLEPVLEYTKKALQYTDHPFRDFADRMFSGRIFLSLFPKKIWE